MSRKTLYDTRGTPVQKVQAGESAFQWIAASKPSGPSNQTKELGDVFSKLGVWGLKYAVDKHELDKKESEAEGKVMALDAINKGYKAQLDFSKYLEEQQGLPNGLNPMTIKSAMMWNARGFAMSDYVKEALENATWYELTGARTNETGEDDTADSSVTISEFLRDQAYRGKTWSETAEILRSEHLQPALELLMDQLPQTASSIDEGFQPAITGVIAKKMEDWKKMHGVSVSVYNMEAAAGALSTAFKKGQYQDSLNALYRPKEAQDNHLLNGVAKGLGDVLPLGANPDEFFFDGFSAHVHGDLYDPDPNSYLHEARLGAALATTKLVRMMKRPGGGKIGEGTTKDKWNALEANLQLKLTQAARERGRVDAANLKLADEFHERFLKDNLGKWLAENHKKFGGMGNLIDPLTKKLVPNYMQLLAGFGKRQEVLKAFMKDGMEDKLTYADGRTIEWDVKDPDDDTADHTSSPPQIVFDQSKLDVYEGLNRGFEAGMEYFSKVAGMNKNAQSAQLALLDKETQTLMMQAIVPFMQPTTLGRIKGRTTREKYSNQEAIDYIIKNHGPAMRRLAQKYDQPNYQNRAIKTFLTQLDETFSGSHVEPPKLKWKDTNAFVLANLTTLNELKTYQHRLDWVNRVDPRLSQDPELQEALKSMTAENRAYWKFRIYGAEGSTTEILRMAAIHHPDMGKVLATIRHRNGKAVVHAPAGQPVPVGMRFRGRAGQLTPYEAKLDAYLTQFLASSFDPDFKKLADAEGWSSDATIKFATDSLQHKSRTGPVLGNDGNPHPTLGNGHLLEFIDLPKGESITATRPFDFAGKKYKVGTPMLSWEVILHHDTLP